MKQKHLALLLTLALVLSLCAVSAAAGEEAIDPAAQPETAADVQEPSSQQKPSAGDREETGWTPAASSQTQREPVSPAGPDKDSPLDPETGALLEQVLITPDAVGTVSFSNLERRMRESCLQLLAIEEKVQIIEKIDYDKMYEDLRRQLNDIARMQWGLITMPDGVISAYEKDKSYDQLEHAYDALRETFDAIKDGELQKDNDDAVRQLNHLEDQIVMAGEALYTALAGLEIQEDGLQRQLNAVNRTVEEMELRYQLGQISALQLTQTKAGQTSLASGLETLRMNIQTHKMQLEMMVGGEITGQIQLGAVPAVTEKELNAMDVERDLLTAKSKSYELHAAAKTLADEKKAYEESGGYNAPHSKDYDVQKAAHTWHSAQYTYNNTLQEFELGFRTLYAQVKDCCQIWNGAKAALASEEETFRAAQLKHQQGTLSQNAFLDAQDSLDKAKETVQTAANDLVSTYNTYCWAVQHGILN